MSFSITEADVWPRVADAILEERVRRLNGLLRVQSLDEMRRQQGFIEALHWVLGEGGITRELRLEETLNAAAVAGRT